MPNVYTLRDVRGQTLEFLGPYLLKEQDGAGLPDIQHIVQANTYEDGESFVDARLQPRTLILGVDIVADSLEALPGLRDALYRMLAPVQLGCYVHVLREDRSEREILARYVGGMTMPHAWRDGVLHQVVVLMLRAARPAFYDPAGIVWVFSVVTGAGNWAFPLSFPQGFGLSAIDVTEPKTYEGTVKAYPVIEIIGPASNLIMENLTTEEKLDFKAKAYDIVAGEVVTIDLAPLVKTVTSSINGNIIDKLSDDSDLGTFHIERYPEAAGGINTIRVRLTGGSSATQIIWRFYTQYAGA